MHERILEEPVAARVRRAEAVAVAARRLTSDTGRVVVGRAEGIELQLTDRTLSRFHAELTATESGIVVNDLGSRNGTRAGVVALGRGFVPSGSNITVGATTLRLDLAPRAVINDAQVSSFGRLVGSSRVMRDTYAILERLARTDLSVLLEGETGTGKEIAARALHEASRRAKKPFVVLDCTAIPASLAESVLFGHEKGAFSGASERRLGLFEAANGGTIFLDEIGELPVELQPKLLGVLERREVVAIGSTRPRPVDVRVVSATLRDLRKMVNRGAFRDDLYFRIAQARVRMPSLEEHREDIPDLVRCFLSRMDPDVTAARAISDEALEAIAGRVYPGNVRELANTVERTALLADGPTITGADLAFLRMLSTEGAAATRRKTEPDGASDSEAMQPFGDAKRTLIQNFERDYLERLLQRSGSSLSNAAARAGIDRHTLRELLRRHGLRDA